MTAPTSLETRGLSKSFGSLAATRNVSLLFKGGQRTAIIGPNGAGKTTFFNLLAGNLRADAGAVLLGARDVTGLGLAERARLGIARSFQRNNLFTEQTVRENLAFASALRNGKTSVFWRPMSSLPAIRADAESVAERIGLADVLSVEVRHLSYGAQRQLEVGLALACQPKVLLLDEPTAGMSPDETARMRALIESLPSELTVIVIEHDMDIVMDIADRIVVLDYGSVLVEGTPAEIRESDIVRQRYLGERPGAPAAGGAL